MLVKMYKIIVCKYVYCHYLSIEYIFDEWINRNQHIIVYCYVTLK